MKKYILLLLVICTLPTCQNKVDKNGYEKDPHFKVIKAHGISECNVLAYSDLFENIRYVKLETNKNCLIGRLDKVIFYKNRFFILDKHTAKSVMAFDHHGKFLGQIGKNGRGPGEYIQPSYMAVNPYTNEIAIYEPARKNMMVYDLEGSFLRSFKLKNRIDAFSVVGPHQYAIYFNYYGDQNINVLPKHNLHVINEKGEILHRGFDRTGSNIPNNPSSQCFSHTRNNLSFHPSYDDKIYKITKNNISEKYHIDFGEKSLTEDFLNDLANPEDLSQKTDITEKLRKSGRIYIQGYFETSDYLILKTVYRGTAHDVYYSKATGNIRYGNIYLNDMYGLITGSVIDAFSGNKMISYFIPSQIPLDYYKQLLHDALINKNHIKKEFLKTLKNQKNAGNRMCSKKIKSILQEKDFRPTEREVKDVDAIQPGSNPVLIVHTLKPF